MKHFGLLLACLALSCASVSGGTAPAPAPPAAAPVATSLAALPPAAPAKLASAPAREPAAESATKVGSRDTPAEPRSPHADVGGAPGAPPPAELPDSLPIGEFIHLDTPEGGIEVLHAPASVRRVLVYLHGACGDPRAAEAFKHTLGRYATLVAIYGERSCGSGHPGRFYWNGRVEPLMHRIDAALAAVAEQRNGLLDTQEPLLFGYSQGSEVAQLLTERWPTRFPEVILGGVPSTPSVQSLMKVRSVAIIGGSREFLTPMRTGAWLLTHNGVNARLFVLKGAKHGSFGGNAERDLSSVFEWLLGPNDAAP